MVGGLQVDGLAAFMDSVIQTLEWAWPFALLGLAVLCLRLYQQRRLAQSGIEDIDRMDGKVFEEYLQTAFRHQGYRVLRTPYTGDYGADLILARDGTKTVVQAKRHKRKVGVKAIQEAVAAKGYYGCDAAMVVTNSCFTDQAKTLARRNKVDLWDRDVLIDRLVAARREGKTEASASSSPVPAPSASTAADVPAAQDPTETEPPAACVVCGRSVSDRVRQYCLDRPERFGGKVYCYQHQRYRRVTPRPPSESPPGSRRT